MPAHTKLWYFEQFRMISALSDAQRLNERIDGAKARLEQLLARLPD